MMLLHFETWHYIFPLQILSRFVSQGILFWHVYHQLLQNPLLLLLGPYRFAIYVLSPAFLLKMEVFRAESLGSI